MANALVLALFALLLNQNNSNKLQPGTLLCVHSHNDATSINLRAFLVIRACYIAKSRVTR